MSNNQYTIAVCQLHVTAHHLVCFFLKIIIVKCNGVNICTTLNIKFDLILLAYIIGYRTVADNIALYC